MGEAGSCQVYYRKPTVRDSLTMSGSNSE